ncbi:hypothetical protein Ancab_004635 [Ancistrocladus abbreviatus]
MDLKSEWSSLESMRDNDVATSVNPPDGDDVKIETNGSSAHDDMNDVASNRSAFSSPKEESGQQSNELTKLSSVEHAEVHFQGHLASDESNHLNSGENFDVCELEKSKGKEIENVQPGESPSPHANLSPGIPGKSPQTTTKGYGLKKWRRIKREFSKDGSPSLDSSKMLKRGLPGSVNFVNPSVVPVDVQQKSEGSVSSTNALINSIGAADGFVISGSNFVHKLEFGSMFSAGTDSDNSEDRSSKLSTAASASKSRYDISKALGHPREKYRVKNHGARNLGSTAQRLQEVKGQFDTSKKPRGETFIIEKENSLSSIESDSRSSASVFVREMPSINDNERQSGRPMNYNGKHSPYMPASENQSVEELPGGLSKHGELEDLSQDDAQSPWEVREGQNNNYQASNGLDPLVDSVLMLQSAQNALEKEILKFGEIGKDLHTLCDDTSITTYLEKKLEATRDVLKEKETKIGELEATIHDRKSFEEVRGNMELQQMRYQEIEAELEGLFKQRIQAEVEHLAITGATKNWSMLAENQMKVLEEQKSLAKCQAQTLRRIGDMESKAALLKGQAEQLEGFSSEISGANEVSKMQKRIVKLSSCLFMQLILLVLVFELFVLPLVPNSSVVRPT